MMRLYWHIILRPKDAAGFKLLVVCFIRKNIALHYQRIQPLRESINRELLRLRESGEHAEIVIKVVWPEILIASCSYNRNQIDPAQTESLTSRRLFHVCP